MSIFNTPWNRGKTSCCSVTADGLLNDISFYADKLAAEQRRYFDNLLVDARRELEHQRGEYLKTATELDILRRTTTEETKRLKSVTNCCEHGSVKILFVFV